MKTGLWVIAGCLGGAFGALAAPSLNLGGVGLGDAPAKIKSVFPAGIECKPAEGNAKKEICRLPYCGVEDSKCLLWGVKALPLLRIYSVFEDKKLSKMVVDLDYHSMTSREVKSVLDGLEKNLGSPKSCPIRDFLNDAKATHLDASCEWSVGGGTLLLYSDDGRMKLKLEKAE